MHKIIALLAFATVCSAQFTGYSYTGLAPVGLTNVVEPYKTIVNPYMYSPVVPHTVVPAPVAVAKSDFVKDVFTYPYTYNYNYMPATVADTAEVAAAKAAHFAEFEKVKMRNKREVYTPSYVAGAPVHSAVYKPYESVYKTFATPYAGVYNTPYTGVYNTPYTGVYNTPYTGVHNTAYYNQFYHH